MYIIIYITGCPMTKSIKLFSFLLLLTTFSQAAELDNTVNTNKLSQMIDPDVTQPQTIEFQPQQFTIKQNADHANTIAFLECFLEHRKITDAHFNFLTHIIRDKEVELARIFSQYQALAKRLSLSLTLASGSTTLTDQELDFRRKSHIGKINQLSVIEVAHRNSHAQYRELLDLQKKYRDFFYHDQYEEEEIARETKEMQDRKDLASYLTHCFHEQNEAEKKGTEYITMIKEYELNDHVISATLLAEEEIRNELLLEDYERTHEEESRQAASLYAAAYDYYDSDDDRIFVPKLSAKKSVKKRKITTPTKTYPSMTTAFYGENDENASPNMMNKRRKEDGNGRLPFSPVKSNSISSNGTTDNELFSQNSLEFRTRQISQDY